MNVLITLRSLDKIKSTGLKFKIGVHSSSEQTCLGPTLI